MAITGQDRVVQPHEDVTLNGVESRDDKKIVKYDWTIVSGHPSVVMSVCDVWMILGSMNYTCIVSSLPHGVF